MATSLKKTNIVIVGLGAAGGVACLPLAQAGIEVIGLDAGPRLDTRDMAPDELRLSRKAWPPSPQKTASEGPTFRPNATTAAVQGGHPMMNAVGGTSIHYWAQSWRLNPWDFKVRSETIRRYGVSRIPKGSTVKTGHSTITSSNPTTIRSSTRSACPARRATSTEISMNSATSSKPHANANIPCR